MTGDPTLMAMASLGLLSKARMDMVEVSLCTYVIEGDPRIEIEEEIVDLVFKWVAD